MSSESRKFFDSLFFSRPDGKLSLQVLGANQTQLTYGDNRIFFSYSTPVAAFINGAYIRTQKLYSDTTSKHITRWLAGNDATFVPQCEIDALLS